MKHPVQVSDRSKRAQVRLHICRCADCRKEFPAVGGLCGTGPECYTCDDCRIKSGNVTVMCSICEAKASQGSTSNGICSSCWESMSLLPLAERPNALWEDLQFMQVYTTAGG